MATTDIKYTLNGQLAQFAVTKNVKNEKILTLVSSGPVDRQRVISEIMLLNPGLERETVEAVVSIEQRVVKHLVLNGHHVNMGLYQVVAQFTGVVENNTWNPEKNTVYASFTQGTEMRQDLRQVNVVIVGEKSSTMYVAGTQDSATRATNATATLGRNFTVMGAMIKVVGTDPAVGITLTNVATQVVTPIADDMWALNAPSKLIILIPAHLEEGEYILRITTQYSGNSKLLLKTARSAEVAITIT